MFLIPVITFFSGDSNVLAIGRLAFGLMATTYLPMLRFYGRNPAWVLGFPAVGLFYLAMTWTSAWRYWNGEKSRWKNRVYERQALSEKVGYHVHNELEDIDS